MLERSHEEQEQLIASLESIVECYKMEMALNRLQRDELVKLVNDVRQLLIDGKPNIARERIDNWILPIDQKPNPIEDEIAKVMT